MGLKTCLWIFGFLFLLIACNYRTPSNVRFEKSTGIGFPDSATIIQDRFEETGPDYGLIFEFELKEKECSEIYKQLESSSHWKKIEDTPEFIKIDDRIIYKIQILKEKNIVSYQEELI